jgi:hypothetical protein
MAGGSPRGLGRRDGEPIAGNQANRTKVRV